MADDQLSQAEKLYDKVCESMKNNPRKTITVILLSAFILMASGFLFSFGSNLGSFFSKEGKPSHFGGYKDTQVIYSNIVPIESDKIELDNSGSLIPAPYNFTTPFTASPEGQCVVASDESLPYAEGIVLVRNTPTIFGENKTTFIPPTPADYFVFGLGDSHEITTGGRTFRVTLSFMNDLTDEENVAYGGYFSYTFDIVEI